ncbi:MAG: COX15/CtaA family protein [Myxococcales bacterium]|nr:COX15/CtaA family protein [Myxococcales bacterium]
MSTSRGFAALAWGLLAYDVGVVAWGAYVRATGSGAGCGRHWPLCNGEVMPRAPRTETLIELSHRLTAGGALVLTAIVVAWAVRAYPRGHLVRRGAVGAAVLMVAEALIGAGLVLFELVAHDASATRALSVSLHLVNTFFLLAVTALSAFWASPSFADRPPAVPQLPQLPQLRQQGPVLWVCAAPLVALLFVGASGAVAALGDTLFPSTSLASGLALDFAPHGHWLVRLRALHPLLAACAATLLVACAAAVRALRPDPSVRRLSRAATALALVQVGSGLLDIVTLAPVWMQIVHLVLADTVWIAWVLTCAAALATQAGAEVRAPAAIFPPAE